MKSQLFYPIFLLLVLLGCSSIKPIKKNDTSEPGISVTQNVDPVDLAKQFVKKKGWDKWLDLNSATLLEDSETQWSISFICPDSKAAGEQPYAHYFTVDKHTHKVEKIPIY